MPSEDGGLVVILEKREAPDDTKLAQKRTNFEQRILSNQREMAFYEWLRNRDTEAGWIQPKTQG
jgi:hypothetical protein